MSKISDELREFAYLHFSGSENVGPCDALMGIADRIDAEMAELPKTADGMPLHVGDTAYTEDGDGFEIVRIIIDQGMTKIVCSTGGDVDIMRTPSYVFHERPDSLERIADELEAWYDGADVDGDACDVPRAIVGRILRLAKRED